MSTRFNLNGTDEPEELPSQIADVNLFSVLGATPLLGRTFIEQDGAAGTGNVVILSRGLWQRRFAGEPAIVGKTITLNGENFTIVGVMPAGFQMFVKQGSQIGKPVDLWLPWTYTPQARVRRGRGWMAVARLKSGISVEQAQTEMSSIAARFEQQYPEFNKGWGVNIVPLRDQIVGDIKPALLVLLAAVGFVLLIACANVANLLLARAATRQKEIAIRIALGAGRWRVIRQLLTESLLLSIVGGAAGLLLALWGTELLLALGPRDLLGIDRVGIDRRVLLFTACSLSQPPALQHISLGLPFLFGCIKSMGPNSKPTGVE